MSDEFEVEVTDLRTGQRSSVRQRDDAGAAAPVQPSARAIPIDDGLEPTPIQPSEQSQRRRSAQVAACAVVLVALAVLLLPVSPLNINRVVASLTPTKAATVGRREAALYMIHAVPWGTLTVDGKVAAAIQNGSDYSSVTLTAGTHTIVYDAAPFPVVRCQVTVPDNGHNPCPVDQNPYDAPNISDPNARVVDLRATVADLLPGDLSALTAKVESSLVSLGGHTQLRAGDHYLDTSGNTRLASGNMQAIVSYTLATTVQPGQGCAAICDQFGMGAGPNGPAWLITANLMENWRYLSANGPETSGPRIGQNDYPPQLGFAVTWNGSWRITRVD
ncbi:MAG: hypothetical protein ACRDHE_08835, partial [Ktedonobacterales bacterium]